MYIYIYICICMYLVHTYMSLALWPMLMAAGHLVVCGKAVHTVHRGCKVQ